MQKCTHTLNERLLFFFAVVRCVVILTSNRHPSHLVLLCAGWSAQASYTLKLYQPKISRLYLQGFFFKSCMKRMFSQLLFQRHSGGLDFIYFFLQWQGRISGSEDSSVDKLSKPGKPSLNLHIYIGSHMLWCAWLFQYSYSAKLEARGLGGGDGKFSFKLMH